VDEERFEELPPRSRAPGARIILIRSPDGTRVQDPRILSRLDRPSRLSLLYESIQVHLERTPRLRPRVPTKLSARCIRAERRAIGAVLSLSEGGCLLRTGEPLRKGTRLDLQFALPNYGLVSTRAECRYRRAGDAGVAFSEPPADVRHTIAHYVTLQLAASAQPANAASL
jgi:hypothetical protein